MTAAPFSIFGSFGFGNLGDELVPDCARRLFAAAGRPAPDLVVTRYEKPRDKEVTNILDARDRVVSPEGRGTLMLSGGGIVEPRPRSCLNSAFGLAEAHPGLDVRAFGISVEPGRAFGWRQRRQLRAQLERMGTVGVRDALSSRVIQALAPGHRIRITGDIGLWSEATALPEALQPAVADRPIAVILQSTWTDQAFFDWLADDLAELSARLAAPILLLPISLSGGKDIAVHGRLRDALAARAPGVTVRFPAESLPAEVFTHDVVATLLGEARLCVSMRLHGCVMAYARRTPFVGLAYHPKLAGFVETVNWSRFLLPDPRQLPSTQSEGIYGYRFEDLPIAAGDLVGLGERAVGHGDFSGVDFWRARQIDVLDEVLGPV